MKTMERTLESLSSRICRRESETGQDRLDKNQLEMGAEVEERHSQGTRTRAS